MWYRDAPMQRWTVVVFAGLFAFAVVVVVTKSGASFSASGRTPPAAGSPATLVAAPAIGVGREEKKAVLLLDTAAPLASTERLTDPNAAESASAARSDRPASNPAGPSMLPDSAPKSVGFGAILIEYRGTEGATRSARSKEDAKELASALAALAKEDFAKAVTRGDRGSATDLGTMPRGVLEPGPELALFTLGVGDVSEPVDGPRGFYVFKRTE